MSHKIAHLFRRCFITVLLIFLLAACRGPAVAPAPTASPESPPSLADPSPTASHRNPASPTLPPSQAPTLSPAPATPAPTQQILPATPTEPPITTLLFSGIIVPARCVQAALDANSNPNYPYEEVQDIISKADIAVGTLNATMSDKIEHTGCWRTYQLVGSPDNADALEWAGFDVMGVATNHIKDCGAMKSWCDFAMFDTLENLRRVGILPVGAGEDLQQALGPVVVEVNGLRFGFVSLGDSKLSPTVFATETNPGIAFLSAENMRKALADARKVADVVIALPHWGSEDNLLPNWWQREQARYTVDSGADLVVGNHTHVIQAFQTLVDPQRQQAVPVFYGLGNFIFDQGLRDHRQSVLLLVRFQGRNFLDYQLIPLHTDPDGRAHLADPTEAAEILQRIKEASDLLD